VRGTPPNTMCVITQVSLRAIIDWPRFIVDMLPLLQSKGIYFSERSDQGLLPAVTVIHW
jgi:hypothetical protein